MTAPPNGHSPYISLTLSFVQRVGSGGIKDGSTRPF
jgi:hypothetical protein